MFNRNLLLKIILLRRIQRKWKRKPRSTYIRPIFLHRNVSSEFRLVEELREDPFYHSRYFRMTKNNFDELLEKVRHRISHPENHLRPISPIERLAVTLRYLASGNSQVSLALNYRISPSAVCNINKETMQAICDEIVKEELPQPTEEMWKLNEVHFSSRWNFPNACGALDRKHVRIVCPSGSSSENFNYKDFFSIVLLAIVNAKYMYTAIDIGSPGSQSDGGILLRSSMGKLLESGNIGIPKGKQISPNGPVLPYVILGDSVFPLKSYLMRLFKGNWLQKEDKIFNYRLSRARMVVENAFGILAARWRIFRTMIHAEKEVVKLITLTSILLHNFLIRKKDMNSITVNREEGGIIIPGNWRDEVRTDDGLTSLPIQGSNNHSRSSSDIRLAFKEYMLSQAGQVTWQDTHVMRGSN